MIIDYSEIGDRPPPFNTLILNMPFDVYTEEFKFQALRASELREAYKSAAHYYESLFRRHKETPEMFVGTLVHQAVLEPKKFPKFATEFSTKPKRDAWDTASEIASKIELNESAVKLVHAKEVYREASVFWRDRFSNLLCKARIDVVAPSMAVPGLESGYVLDLKTVRDCTPYAFANEVIRYGYAIQLAHYTEAALACGMITHESAPTFILACEKTPPYAMICYDMSPWQDLGQRWRKMAIATAAQAKETGIYPAYGDETRVLEPPSWVPHAVDVEFHSAEPSSKERR